MGDAQLLRTFASSLNFMILLLRYRVYGVQKEYQMTLEDAYVRAWQHGVRIVDAELKKSDE